MHRLRSAAVAKLGIAGGSCHAWRLPGQLAVAWQQSVVVRVAGWGRIEAPFLTVVMEGISV